MFVLVFPNQHSISSRFHLPTHVILVLGISNSKHHVVILGARNVFCVVVFTSDFSCFPTVLVFQYAKLAITLSVPGGGKKKKAAAAPGDGGVNSGADKPEEEEDEYAGGLC